MTPEQIQQEAKRLASVFYKNVKYADRVAEIIDILTERERLRQELAEANEKLSSYSDDCAMMDSLREELRMARLQISTMNTP
jgi:hypothetical protein